MKQAYRTQELVVYERHKHSTHPGPRARSIRPAPLGDAYDYVVDKFWVVQSCDGRGRLVLRTPGGKLHEVEASDPCLRRPTWREKMWLRWSDPQRLHALRQTTV